MSTSYAKHILWVILVGIAMTASAAYVAPTAEQLAAAAADPSADLPALLKEASADQVADVVKVVAEEIVRLNLSPKDQAARLAELIRVAFGAVPEKDYNLLAAALGSALSISPVVSGSPGAMDAVRSGIITAGGGGEVGSGLAASFDQTFEPGAGAPPPAPNPQPFKEKSVQTKSTTSPSPTSPSPPAGPTYGGQNIP